ncbi:MAG: GNAT family N-acetyltransferase [Planctomycetes bacterium]|nr:GNAT family N-acetyltransferase [Planctomycetota bacterium]
MPAKRKPPCPYEIRGPRTRQEAMALADLYGKAFGNWPRLFELCKDLFLHRMPREQWRLSRAMWAPDGTPIAQVRIADRTMRLGAALVRVAGIGDVCTLPHLRKKGMMRSLFDHVNQFMRDEGYDLSLLFGIPNFYDKFGFITGVANDGLLVSRQQLAELKAPHRGRRARRADAAAIRRLHLDDLAARDGAMARWGGLWARRSCREKWCRIIEDAKGRPSAYWRGEPRGDDAFALTEVSLGRRPSRDAVVSVLADLARAAKACEKPKVRIELPTAHPIGQFCLADGCEVHRTVGHRGGAMVRIVGLESLCRRMAPEWQRLLASWWHRLPACVGEPPITGKMPVPPVWNGRLRLKTDIGAVDLVASRGKIEVVGGASLPRVCAPATVTASQANLCRLILGFHTPSAALALGEARITPAARPLAAAIFPTRSLAFFPWDRF